MYPDGPVSNALAALHSSGAVEVSLAEGTFVMAVGEGQLEDGDTVTDVALIAGGTGITPMMGLLRDCLRKER